MAKELFLVDKAKLESIADNIREQLGTTNKMSLDDIGNNIKQNMGKKPILEEKSITPTKETQVVSPSNGKTGLSKVTVNAIPSQYIIPSGSETKTANGTYNVTNLSELVVNVPSSSGGAKVEQGTCDMTSSLLTINHSLGVKPDFVIAWCSGTSSNTQRTHVVVYDSKVSTSYAKYQYYRSDAGINKNVNTSKGSTSYVYIGADAVTLPYYSSTYVFSGTYYYIVGTYS